MISNGGRKINTKGFTTKSIFIKYPKRSEITPWCYTALLTFLRQRGLYMKAEVAMSKGNIVLQREGYTAFFVFLARGGLYLSFLGRCRYGKPIFIFNQKELKARR